MFAPFLRFPAEIHSHILLICPPNDATCLSLTCKYMYKLFKPLNLPRILSTVDTPLCLKPGPEPRSEHVAVNVNRYWRSSEHRRTCHGESYDGFEKLNSDLEANVPGRGWWSCRTAQSAAHCECYAVPLHKRLKSWVPGDLRYCASCWKYTRRLAKYKNRCKHGCKRRRVGRKNHWTYRKRRAGNGNTVEQQGVDGGSMNLRITGLEQQRKGNARYELRRLVGSRVVKVMIQN